MATFDSFQGYFKVASLRMKDAEELLQPPSLDPKMRDADVRHLRGAVYLSGYAVECVLKAYIISVAPDSEDGSRPTSLAAAGRNHLRDGRALPNLLTVVGHDIELLIDEAELPPMLDIDARIAIHASVCQKWHHASRYDPSPLKRARAGEIVRSARVFYDWVRARIV